MASAKALDAGFADLLDVYAPIAGAADELLDADGRIREVWHPLLSMLAGCDSEALDDLTGRADQYLRDGGVFFRQYTSEGSTERDWPLSHIPVLIREDEWTGIANALIERADILEELLADIYGENRLVADGVLPPTILAENPEWLRPMVGIAPRGGHYLHHVAFDIGRGPNGQWWVLADRTQAPSGAGFALETRMATSRSFSTLMQQTNVRRLAGFYRLFRDALQAQCGPESSRVGILTPGPLNDTYFEHAYIARYLGFSLVQGADLAVRDDRLMVRTVSGERPMSVLWRRLDSGWSDPLELLDQSKLGTPGMVDALRAQSFTMVNALGSGVLEARAMMAFLPRIARRLTGKPLTIPNIATWWCGGDKERAYVIENNARMTIDDAMSTSLPFDHSDDVIIGGKTSGGGRVNPAWIEAQAGNLAAQEILSLSTTPVLSGGRLEARPMSLRVFLARTRDGWTVMPGGFARVGQSFERADVSMQRGGSVCDVWVVSDRPEEPDTLLTQTETGYRRSQLGDLPITAADNLFWLGRYVERVEGHIRLLRAYHLRLAETGAADNLLGTHAAAILKARGVLTEQAVPAAVMTDIAAALRSAGHVRDRFATDGWNALVDLQKTAVRLSQHLRPGDDAARAHSVFLRKISGFSGLVHENMYRFTGWRFLSIGRALERCGMIIDLVQASLADTAPVGAFEMAIEVGDSVMTHRRRYTVETHRETVIDLLLLDDMNPRSAHYQLQSLLEHVQFLPTPGDEAMTPLQARLMQMTTGLATVTADDMDDAAITRLSGQVGDIAELLADAYLR